MTSDCNWSCAYCYQRKEKKSIDQALLKDACSFFSRSLTDESLVNFCGGEPLLALDSIRLAVEILGNKTRAKSKGPRFTVTTNGSLVTSEAIRLFSRFDFEVLVSHDGLAQDERRPGTRQPLSRLLDRLLGEPRILTATNSVFTPRTVNTLAASIRSLAERGIPKVYISLSNNSVWSRGALAKLADELRLLRRWLRGFYEKHGRIPVVDFRKPDSRGMSLCSAGRSRLALASDGTLWGCHFFPEYFAALPKDSSESRKYRFGGLGDFLRDPEGVLARKRRHYAPVRIDYGHTARSFCQLCRHLEQCAVCPVAAALVSSVIGRISNSTCRLSRLLIRERKLFWDGVKPAAG